MHKVCRPVILSDFANGIEGRTKPQQDADLAGDRGARISRPVRRLQRPGQARHVGAAMPLETAAGEGVEAKPGRLGRPPAMTCRWCGGPMQSGPRGEAEGLLRLAGSKPGIRPEPTSGHPAVRLHDPNLSGPTGALDTVPEGLVPRPTAGPQHAAVLPPTRVTTHFRGDTARSLSPLVCPCHPGVVLAPAAARCSRARAAVEQEKFERLPVQCHQSG